MEQKLDFYHRWLGIPPDEQPPNHYRLLGIPLLEASAEVIENAANQRMGHLRTFQTGKHAADSQRLLNEVAAARVCLLRPDKKAAYDQELRKKLAPKAAPVTAEAEAIDAELAQIFQTPPATGISAFPKHRGKKPDRFPLPVVIAITGVVAAVVLLGLSIYFSPGGKPDQRLATATASNANGSAGPPRNSTNGVALPSKPRPSTSADSAAAAVPTSPKTATAAAQKTLVGSKTSGTQSSPAKTEDFAVGPSAAASATSRGTAAPAQPESAPESAAPLVARPASDSSADEQTPPNEQKKAARHELPPAEKQKRLIAEIDEIYKSKEAKDPAARAALARKLFEEGQKQGRNTDEQFALLRRASELASDAGEADLVVEVVDAMAAAGFDIQSLRAKSLLLKRMFEQSVPEGQQLSAACEACTRFAEDAAAEGAADDALDVLQAARKAFAESARRAQSAYIAARAAAARMRDATEKAERAKTAAQAESQLDAAKEAQSAVAQCVKNIQQTMRQRQAVQAAQEKLKVAPDDPAACLTIGRWRCFHEGAWDDGLKFLAKGSDPTLKALAADELASKPSTADRRVARGDAWWDAAEKAAGDDKPALRRRAEHWYSETLPDLTGLARAKVEKRLKLLAKDAATAAAAKAASAAGNAALVKTESVGGSGGEPFEESDAGAVVVGFNVTTRSFRGHKVISSVQAVYNSRHGQVSGKLHGKLGDKPVTLLAKPGYAVAGIGAASGGFLKGFRIAFMRVKGHQLDPTQSYESDYVGGVENLERSRVGCDGKVVVGVFGREGTFIDALGLIQLVPGQGRPAARGAAVTIVSAQWGREQTWADVTARVQELVDAGAEFSLTPQTLQSDPAPSTRKRLIISYRKNGKEKTLSFDEVSRDSSGASVHNKVDPRQL